ncbi:hypothetical protein [Leucobacter iarius]|uniref:Ig-like domain-containing protein n=1 Tax=Leucobacter iarius TaxID=333963 RepID=A0ABN2L9N0_9MICO
MPSSSFKRPLPRGCIALSTLAVSGIAALTLPFGAPALAEEGTPTPRAEASQTAPMTTPGPTDAPSRLEAEPAEEELPEEEVIGHLTVTPMQAYPGEKVRVTGQCKIWGHGPTDVWLWLSDPYVEASFSTVAFDEATGEFDTEVTLSKAAPPGKYRMPWMCSVDDQVFAGSDVDPIFTVLGTTTPPPQKPPTTSVPPPTSPNGGTNTAPSTSGTPEELAQTGAPAGPEALAFLTGLLTIGGISTARAARRRPRNGA